VEAKGHLSSPFTSYLGYYTLALKLPAGDLGDVSLPQGHGYASFRISSLGTASGYAYLADRTGVPLSGSLRSDGSFVVYQSLYAATGSMLGALVVTPGSPALVSGQNLSWSKAVQPGSTRSYAAGWPTHGPILLEATGSRYTTGSAIIVGATASADNVPNTSLLFTEGQAPSPTTRLNTTLRFSSPAVRDPQTPLAGSNPGRVSIFINASTGAMSGSFNLTDTDTSILPNAPLTRAAYFYGILTRDSDGQQRALGHFNLAEMPTAGPPRVTLTPIHSGTVTLQGL
jgi:hypothetical protein